MNCLQNVDISGSMVKENKKCNKNINNIRNEKVGSLLLNCTLKI